MKKVITTVSVLILSCLLFSCSASEPPTYGLQFDYIAKDIELDNPPFKLSSMNVNELNSYIKGDYSSPEFDLFVTKKVGSYSYYWKQDGEKLEYNEVVCTVSKLEIEQVLSSENNEYSKGDIIEIIEFYGVNPQGVFYSHELKNEILYPNPEEYSEGEFYYEGYQELLYKPYNGCWLEINKQYIIGVGKSEKFTEEDVFYYREYVNSNEINYIELPKALFVGKYSSFSAYEFSNEAYAESVKYLNTHDNNDTSYKYYEAVKQLWEANGLLVTENNSQTTLAFTLGFSAIFICIIAVGIILIKRSKTTPSGTPPTVEQNSPDAQETHDTPVAEAKTASPPDVTEPPGPPKEE